MDGAKRRKSQRGAMDVTPGSCRCCCGTEFYTKTVDANGGYGPTLLPLGVFASPKFQIVVCSGCGLVEWYVAPQYLERVRERFQRVPPGCEPGWPTEER